MARLPKVGDDKGTWGDILNDFLEQSHNADGTLKADIVGAPQLRQNAVTSAAVADGALAQAKVAGLTDALSTKADASSVVTLTGTQTISGDKDFTGQLSQGGNAIVTTVDGRLSDQRIPVDGSVTASKLAPGAVTTAAIADGQVSTAKLQGAGVAGGIATLDSTGTLREEQVPARLSDAQLATNTAEIISGRGLDRSVLSSGRRWLTLGDSITNGSTAGAGLSGGNFPYSYPQIAMQAVGSLNARLDFIEAGTSGYKASDILAWLPTFIDSYSDVGGATIMVGTNDSTANVSLASYSSSITAIVGILKARGIPVVLCTPIPRGTSGANAANRLLIAQYGAWIRMWGPENGVTVADTHAAVVDSATGDLAAAYFDSGDPTHPTTLGHSRLGQTVASAILRAIRTPRTAFQFAKTAFSRVANPMMSGTGPRPTGYYEQPGGSGTAPTYSTFADTTGLLPAGQWAQMDFDATASGGTRQLATGADFTGMAAGHKIATLGIAFVEDLTGTWETDVIAGNAAFRVRLANQSNVTIVDQFLRFPGRNVGDALKTGYPTWQFGPMFTPVVIPAGTTGLLLFVSLTLPTGKHVRFRVGGLDLISLTAMGLESLAGGNVVNLDGPPPA